MTASGDQQARAKAFFLYAGGLAALFVALAVVVAVVRSGSKGDSDGGSGTGSATSTSLAGSKGDSTASTKPADVFPDDRVAYVTSDGRVMSGIGAAEPVQVGDQAARGSNGQGSLAVSPTGDLIAYIRADGAVISVPAEGGETKVLATDAWMPAVGTGSALAWDPASAWVAYIAVGTQDMVEPRSETQDPPSVDGAFSAPLPEGTLGAVIKVVDRNGELINRMGDPSTRSISGITYSTTDDLILVESTIPGKDQPYTLATASAQQPGINGTVLSADDPAFSPDGNFILAVGPRPGGRELLRISTETFSRVVLTSSENICNPSVSPDSTRIAFGAGEDCSKLMLISSKGGKAYDITPPKRPGLTFATSQVKWTQDGHFVVFPDCRTKDDATTCSGVVSFFDPDRSVQINGIAASTVSTVSRPLIQDITVHLAMDGPIVYEGSFLVDSNTEGELNDVSKAASVIDVVLHDENRSLAFKVEVDTTRKFSSGTMTLVDPEAGINRTFVITGAASLVGMRVASMSGIWFSTADMPFTTGQFRLSVLRG
ncbi:MAG: hypothetical protein KDB26_01370 [Microthrixaceae bacterium]|nr:hypothetical protein [Microthrixaceae bacterium]